MRRLGFTLLLSAGVLLSATNAFAMPVARLQMQSDPGNYVGEGGSYDVIYEDTDGIGINIYRYVDANLSLPPYGLLLSLNDAPPPTFSNWAFMTFQTNRAGVPLIAGFYPNASDSPPELDPAHPHPMMRVGFQHRGTSNTTGQFTIYEITFSSDYSKLLTLFIEFEQHEGGPTAPALRGRLEYRADGLAPIPEPSVALMTLLGLAGLSYHRRMS